VRIAKTRTQAADACRAGHVRINGEHAKPASPVKPGDRVESRIEQRLRIVTVTTLIVKRVGPTVAVDCFEDHSPPVIDVQRPMFAVRDRGAGRPTKRDRRQIDRLRGRNS
jgi:ribosome-associated heat shock protein Hsp15